MTTLAEIRSAASADTFPVDRLVGLRTAGAFFCGAFLGRQDVVHLSDAGLTVEAFDIDAAKVAEMRAAYPGTVQLHVADAYAVAANYGRIGIKYDVVTVDPWTNEIPRALDLLQAWCRLASAYVVIGVSAVWFDALMIDRTAEGVQVWLEGRFPELAWRVAELRQRSTHMGGIWWAVLEPKP